MNVEQTTQYLIKHDFKIPIIRDMKITPIHDGVVPDTAKISVIDLREYAFDVLTHIRAYQAQNARLIEVLKDMAVNNYNVHWYREGKREILLEFFPNLISELPYYCGGDKVNEPRT